MPLLTTVVANTIKLLIFIFIFLLIFSFLLLFLGHLQLPPGMYLGTKLKLMQQHNGMWRQPVRLAITKHHFNVFIFGNCQLIFATSDPQNLLHLFTLAYLASLVLGSNY